jgi:uncharacterized protein (TIGR02246 family)
MRSPLRFALILAASLTLSGCGLLLGHAIREGSRKTQDESQVTASLARYRNLILELQADRVADMFADDGELSHNGEKSYIGPRQISAFLKSFSGYKILKYELVAVSTAVEGENATQNGTYTQTVVAPEGNTIMAAGSFETAWRHQPDGRWLIKKMRTTSPATISGA